MKILHLTITTDIGGGPEHIYQLISGLPAEFESHVACPGNGPYFDKFKSLTGGRVCFLAYRKFEIKYLIQVYRYIKSNKITLLHSHGRGAGLYVRMLSLLMRIPVVHTPHGINQKIEKGLLNKAYIKFEFYLRHFITAIIYVSQSEADYSQKLHIWPGVLYRVINNGTNTPSFTQKSAWRREIRTEMKLGSQKIIITASRFDFQKNTLEFCQIAAELPEITFVILGDGEERKHCESFCISNNIENIIFIGAVSDPQRYFASADLYLSTARWEGLSMAILESMALGLPTVATKVVGNIDLIKTGETGYLYEIGNIRSATKAILRVFDNYNRFSNNVLDFHSKSFSAEAMCRDTATLYKDVLS